MTINSKSKEISRSGQYWAFAHFSRFLRRGAKRFASQSSAEDLGHAAVQRPDGRHVLVLANPASARTASVQMRDKLADVRLEENSVTTLVWS